MMVGCNDFVICPPLSSLVYRIPDAADEFIPKN